MRTKKAIINMGAGLLYEAVALICGMILPQRILKAFGSDYNGITNSISQFLGCIILLRSGIGGVTRAALYKPLAEGDNMAYSRVLRATEIFMRKIAMIFVGFLVVFACVYPRLVDETFDWWFTASLVMILGISTFAEYYFGFTYQMILNADQRQYVFHGIQIFTTILNTIVAVFLINSGCGIHMVKLGSALVFAMNPIFINLYTHRHYKIIRGVEPDNHAVNQRWHAFAHQAANFVNANTDVMVLTFFTNVREVSVYSVYYLVINGLSRLLRNTIPGVAAAFGDMLARGEKELMEKNFRVFELVVYTLATVLYVTCAIMLVPFVEIYTRGIKDVSYIRPTFAILISIAVFFGSARVPYQHVVEAAGHYKQTKHGAYFEALLNITISVLAVFKFGMVGVAFGTVAATIFRTFQYATYLSRNIIPRSNWLFIKHILVSAGVALCSWGLYHLIPTVRLKNFAHWSVYATMACLIVIALTTVTNLLFFREDSMNLIHKVVGVFRRKK